MERGIQRSPKDPLTKDQYWGFDVLFDVNMKELLNEKSTCRWFESPWHLCDIAEMGVVFLIQLCIEHQTIIIIKFKSLGRRSEVIYGNLRKQNLPLNSVILTAFYVRLWNIGWYLCRYICYWVHRTVCKKGFTSKVIAHSNEINRENRATSFCLHGYILQHNWHMLSSGTTHLYKNYTAIHHTVALVSCHNTPPLRASWQHIKHGIYIVTSWRGNYFRITAFRKGNPKVTVTVTKGH